MRKILRRQNCISQTIRHNKIVEGKFWENIFNAHPKHLWTIRYRAILRCILQEKSVSYGVCNTTAISSTDHYHNTTVISNTDHYYNTTVISNTDHYYNTTAISSTVHYLLNITVGQSFSQTVAI
jgi:hypothetical protein